MTRARQFGWVTICWRCLASEARRRRDIPGPTVRASFSFCAPEIEGPIERRLQIKKVGDVGTGTSAGDMRRECAFDDGLAGRGSGDGGYGIREGPGRRGVPDILDRGIVVGRDAEERVDAP